MFLNLQAERKFRSLHSGQRRPLAANVRDMDCHFIGNAHSAFGGQSSINDELVNNLGDKKGTAISVSRKIGEDQLRSEAIPYPQSQPGQLRRHKHAIRHLLLVRTN